MSVERELPDDQKMSDEERKEESEIMTMERAENLSSQYESIKDRTIDENTVLGKLQDINTSPANGNIIVSIDLPAESDHKEFRFNKPKVWSNRYDFVRWIRYYDYDADSFPNMLKDDCRVKVSKGQKSSEYNLMIPNTSTRRRRAYKFVKETISEYREMEALYITGVTATASLIYAILLVTGLISIGLSTTSSIGTVLISFVLIGVVAFLDISFKDIE